MIERDLLDSHELWWIEVSSNDWCFVVDQVEKVREKVLCIKEGWKTDRFELVVE